ncbi:MAG TPA: hypothetical protein VLW85_04835 [Myxococcales bacterium]|nr:hypothetical protein [Myxococcales bacterium]
METTAQAQKTTSSVALAISWLIVGIPLLWGVLETFKKSLALFH